MKALRKDFYVQIKKTLNRFISILLIVALGVAFYAGICSTEPDMRLSADKLYDDTSLMDIKVLSTMGLTEDDVNVLAGLDSVEYAVGTYSEDIIASGGGEQHPVKVMAYTDRVNVVQITEGRLPANENECIVDLQFSQSGYEIGSSITMYSDDLTQNEFEIVGIFTSSEYLSNDKGTTSIGNGKLAGLVVVMPEVFDLDYYTEIYLLAKGAKDMVSYTDEYDDYIETVVSDIEDNAQDICIENRYNEIVDEANEKIDDAQKELDEKEDEYEDALADIEDAKTEISENGQKIEDAKAEILKSENEIKEAKEAYAKARQEYDESVEQFEASKAELENAKTEYEENLEEYNSLLEEYEYAVLLYGEDAVKDTKDLLDEYGNQLKEAEAAIEAGEVEIAEGEKQIAEADKLLKENKNKIEDGEAEIEKAKAEIDDGEAEIESAKKEVADAESELADAKEAIDDAKAEIEEAKAEVKDIERPEWYVLDRNYIQTYVEYGQDASKVGNLGKVFPIIFFIVAAMVSLNTMTRMIEEQRTKIGTMKALGYGKIAIASEYVLYGFFATIIGGVLGGIAGSRLLPYIIINTYKIMFVNQNVVVTPINAEHFSVALIAAVISVIGATILACVKTLRTDPAELMRPAAPKMGKRVLLERIPFIWNHLNFRQKSTVRNLFRYKKRLFMTLFGIGGCMALMLVGFGIKDSVNSIVTIQYGDIHKYDIIVTYDDNADDDEKDSAREMFDTTAGIEKYIEASQTSVDIGKNETKIAGYIFVPENSEQLSEYIYLKNRVSDEEYTLSEDGVVISEKLAKLIDADVGDTIYISNDDTEKYELTVQGICENYLYHYVYMLPEMYEDIYGEEPDNNVALIISSDMDEVDSGQISEQFLENDAVSTVTFTKDTKDKFADMLGSLDTVIVVLVISAGALAFVVLYNLNNINIEERKRELATLKVLGFYDGEVSAYVLRENIIITLLGIVIGIVFGMILHGFIITTMEIDIMMFGRIIRSASYLYSSALTILFAVVINISMHFKLKKVDMATSLKSIE